MILSGRLFLLTAILALGVSSAVRKLGPEERLIKDLLGNYVKLARPVKHPANLTAVSTSIQLIRIADYDIVNNVVKINAWLALKWNDFRLAWIPKDYNGITETHLLPSEIWVPDVKIFNGAKPEMDVGKCPVVVDSSGAVLYVPPVAMEFPCAMDHGGSKFNCKAKLGSWTYNGNQVDLTNQSFEATNFITNPIYNVTEMSVSRNVVYYPCCPEPFVDLEFTFDLGIIVPE